jgi:hypothetical protein
MVLDGSLRCTGGAARGRIRREYPCGSQGGSRRRSSALSCDQMALRRLKLRKVVAQGISDETIAHHLSGTKNTDNMP